MARGGSTKMTFGDPITWRGKQLVLVALETTSVKCELCACQIECFEDWQTAPLNDNGTEFMCMKNVPGVLHHWEIAP